jgi:predicted Fe-S protein YdhL (DUF1289 family)
VRKELRPVHDVVACDVCGRTILKGERVEWYVAPGGNRHQVCDLCAVRARHHGWIRESAAGELPARPPRNESGGMLARLRRRRPTEPVRAEREEPALAEQEAMYGSAEGAEPSEHAGADEGVAQPRERQRTRPKDPRHVRAVPTTAEGKVDRALELFNGSGHQRTIAGLARTLGPAWVSAQPDPAQPSAVSLLVAWELSWYRYRVDLGDEADPVEMLDKGEEMDEIDESLRDWNAALDDQGRVVVDQAPAAG